MKEIYETKILKDFPKATKGELTKVYTAVKKSLLELSGNFTLSIQMLINDVTSREAYYEKNKKIFEAFILKAMDADLKNYPDEKSGINPADVAFLSLMTRATVDKIIEDTIAKKKAPVDDSWKVLTLVDAFRTVYYYCKYPKELAPFLTEKMRVDVKEWLDSTATWGTWGFEDDESDANDNTSELKIEL